MRNLRHDGAIPADYSNILLQDDLLSELQALTTRSHDIMAQCPTTAHTARAKSDDPVLYPTFARAVHELEAGD